MELARKILIFPQAQLIAVNASKYLFGCKNSKIINITINTCISVVFYFLSIFDCEAKIERKQKQKADCWQSAKLICVSKQRRHV
jgi:hypothetical protein